MLVAGMVLGTGLAEAQTAWPTYRGREGSVGLVLPTPPGTRIEEWSSPHSVTYAFTRGDEHALLHVRSCSRVRAQLADKTNPPRFVERWRIVAGPEVGHDLEGQVGLCLYLSAPLDEPLGDDVRQAMSDGRASLWGVFPNAHLEPIADIPQQADPAKDLGPSDAPGASTRGLALLAGFWTAAGVVLVMQRRMRAGTAPGPRVF